MADLKTDPKLPHHYLISVGCTTMRSGIPGKLFLKHGPLYFTNKDVEKLQGATILSKDKLFKTSEKQALINFDCLDLVRTIRSMELAASANECSIHHFSSKFKIGEQWFIDLVRLANTMEHNMELLTQSRVR